MANEFFKTVWLVDDDELSNFVNRTFLKTQHFSKSIVTFTSIEEALVSLDLAIKEEVDFPDILFLDMHMPGMDGWDFLEAFRPLPRSIKEKCRLYMLSSSIHESDAMKARQEEDIRAFIVKPLNVETLEAIKTSNSGYKPNEQKE